MNNPFIWIIIMRGLTAMAATVGAVYTAINSGPEWPWFLLFALMIGGIGYTEKKTNDK
jgi:uncharacterized membrane protein